jgi:monofunctional biosynthetic peptidoglycan transglycosylase
MGRIKSEPIWEDDFHPKFFTRNRIIIFSVLVLLLLMTAWCVVFYFSLPDVSYLKKRNPKTTSFIEMRQAGAKQKGRPLRVRQSWVQFRQIPKLFQQAVRITEDASFYQHEGVDYEELKESIMKDLEEGKFLRGASTITQQLAKNLYLSTEKTLMRKLKEYFIARRLESVLGKNRIFHLYLNVIEFGHGIYGVQAASRYYFKEDVENLTLEQIVRLTAIIPRPLSLNPKGNNRWLKWKCRWILGKMLLYKFITQEQYQDTVPVFN